MSDSKNMKSLNPATEEAIALYNSMDEGAKSVHLTEKKDRALFDNFQAFIDQGIPRVAAMEKAVFASRNPRNVSDTDLKDVRKYASKAAKDVTRSWVGAMPFNGTSMDAPKWYQDILHFQAEQGITANLLGGYTDVDSAAKAYKASVQSNYTRLPDGKLVQGTVPVLAARMNVVPEDVTKYFNTYLEMNKNYLEDAGHVPISDMYFVTNPDRGTFQIKTRLGDVLNQPTPLVEMKSGAGAFLRNKDKLFKQNWYPTFDGSAQSGALGIFKLSKPETHLEDKDRLIRTIAMVEGNGGWDNNVKVFKPYRDGNGKQWNIGYGLKISDKEYNQDYIVRDGTRYDLGRIRPSQVTANVAKSLMEKELDRGANEIRGYWSGYDTLPAKYQGVLQSLHYNTGSARPSNWPKLKQAMDNNDDAAVKREMVTSYTDRNGDKKVLQDRANIIYKRLFNK